MGVVEPPLLPRPPRDAVLLREDAARDRAAGFLAALLGFEPAVAALVRDVPDAALAARGLAAPALRDFAAPVLRLALDGEVDLAPDDADWPAPAAPIVIMR